MKKGILDAITGKSFKINTVKELDSFAIELYVLAAFWALLILLLVFWVANGVKYAGGANPKDHLKRRRIFYLMGLLPPIVLLLFNLFYLKANYLKASAALLAKFSSVNFISVLVSVLVYFVLGLLTSFLTTGKKWGTITRKKMV